MSKPIELGVVEGVVAIIYMDYEGLQWLADELPQDDAFTREIKVALRNIVIPGGRPQL